MRESERDREGHACVRETDGVSEEENEREIEIESESERDRKREGERGALCRFASICGVLLRTRQEHSSARIRVPHYFRIA